MGFGKELLQSVQGAPGILVGVHCPYLIHSGLVVGGLTKPCHLCCLDMDTDTDTDTGLWVMSLHFWNLGHMQIMLSLFFLYNTSKLIIVYIPL